MVIDTEDYFSQDEILKVRRDIEYEGLSLIVIGEWYNKEIMGKHKFFNNNTFEMWTPFMAGANVPSLNALLEPYHIAFGDSVYSGDFYLDKRQVVIDSSTEIIQFPKNGYLISATLNEESSEIFTKGLLFEEQL